MNQHHRRSVRLKGYDYAQAGAYFVTICTHECACLFGEIVDGEMQLNVIGRLVDAEWRAISTHFPQTIVDDFVVMPNHIHGILMSARIPPQHEGAIPSDIPTDPVGARFIAPSDIDGNGKITRTVVAKGAMNRAPTLGEIIRAVKARVRRKTGFTVWQRNYYEHIIRNDDSLNRAREYIRNNPTQWELDYEIQMRCLANSCEIEAS